MQNVLHHLKPHRRPLILLRAEIRLKDQIKPSPVRFQLSHCRPIIHFLHFLWDVNIILHPFYKYNKTKLIFPNLITGLQLKSKDAKLQRSHFPDVGHSTWKQQWIMRNNWQSARQWSISLNKGCDTVFKETILSTVMVFWACCQASRLVCSVCWPHWIGKVSGFNVDCTTFRCAWQSGLGCHQWVGKHVFLSLHFEIFQI